MLVNEYKPEFQFGKSPKNAEFRQILNLRAIFSYERTDAQNGLDFHFKKYDLEWFARCKYDGLLHGRVYIRWAYIWNAVSVSNMVGLCSGGERGGGLIFGWGAYSRRFTVRLTRHKTDGQTTCPEKKELCKSGR